MHNFKKHSAAKFILCCLMVLITGCANSANLNIPAPQLELKDRPLIREPASRPADKHLVFRMAEYFSEYTDYPVSIGDMEFARLVEERTQGRIKINIYFNAKLGDEKSVIEQVQFGGIDFARVNIAPLSDLSNALNILSLPYLFRNSDHMWNVLNGPIGEELLNALSKEGILGLAYYDSGARSFYTKTPVRKISDMKNLRIRVQQSKLYMDLVSSLGARPIQINFGDVYNAFQSNEIDGAENNWSSYHSTKHYELAKYYTLDTHTRTPEMVIASKSVMDKLSKEDMRIIKQAARDSITVQRKAWADYEKKAEEDARNSGVKVFEPDTFEKSEFEKAVAPLYEIYGRDYRYLIQKIQDTR